MSEERTDRVEEAAHALLSMWDELAREGVEAGPLEHCRSLAQRLKERGILRPEGIEWGVRLRSFDEDCDCVGDGSASWVVPVQPNTYSEAQRWAELHGGSVEYRSAPGPWREWVLEV